MQTKYVILKSVLLIGWCSFAGVNLVLGQAETQNPTFPFWKIKGNSNTNSQTNFIGTTDPQAFSIRVNGEQSGRIEGFGSYMGAGNTSYGYAALYSSIFSLGLPTGTGNTAMGYYALHRADATTLYNVAIGYTALEQNTSGTYNAAVGSSSISFNIIGSYNSALGHSSLGTNSTGTYNSSVGAYSGYGISSGSYNSFLGANSGGGVNNINSTAIGAYALVNANNAIVLGSVNGVNGATATVNVGIGNNNPTARLHVTGVFRLEDGTQAYDRVLMSDALGNASWKPADSVLANTATAIDWHIAGNTGTNDAIHFIGTNDNADLALRTFNTEKVRINTIGDMGVGTASPVNILHLHETNAINNPEGLRITAVFTGATNTDGLFLGTTISAPFEARLWQYENSDLAFGTNNTERMRISAGGFVGIGTASPTAYLHIHDALGINPRIRLSHAGNTSQGTQLYITTGTPSDFVIDNTETSGRVMLKNLSGAQIELAPAGSMINTLPAFQTFGINNDFTVSATGDLTQIKNVPYSWPAANAAGVLTNNGVGTLTWAPAGAAGSGWNLNGNTGTLPGTDFIGTNDAADWVIKTTGLERIRVAADGHVGMGAAPTANDQLYVYNNAKGPNISNIYAYAGANAGGTDWTQTGVAAMIKAYSFWGNPYSAAIAGYSYQDYAGSAAVIGANQNGLGAGFLGYYDGTTRWGVYTDAGVPAYVRGNLQFDGALMPGANAGNAGEVLTSAGAGLPPTWSAAGGGSGWLLTGNAGTTAGTNFVGTTDAVDLVFKTGGAEKMRIVNSTNRVGINTASPSRILHVNGDSRFQGNSYIDNFQYHYATNAFGTSYYKIAGMNLTNELTFADLTLPAISRFYVGNAGANLGLNFQSSSISNIAYMDGVNGRLGVGTGLPSRTFQVNGDSRFQGNSYIDNFKYHYATNAFGTSYYAIAGMNLTNELTFADLTLPAISRFYVGNAGANLGLNFQSSSISNIAYMDGVNGRLGVGTGLPSRTFQVNGDSRFQGNSYIDNFKYHYATNAFGTSYYAIAGMNLTNELTFADLTLPAITRFYVGNAGANLGLNFQSSSISNIAYMDGVNGRLGVGTGLPSRTFQVNGDSRFQGNSYIDNFKYHYATNVAGTSYYKIAGMNLTNELTFADLTLPAITRFYVGNAAANLGLNFQSSSLSNIAYLDGVNGRVGIGTGAPAYQLELSTASAAMPGGGSWTASSDKRLKKDIKPYTDGLEQLMGIEPVTYHYNAASGFDTKPQYVGVIAQELKEIAPYMVGTFKKDSIEYYNVNNSAMTYMLVNSVKELKKQNDILLHRIEGLEKQLHK